MKFLLALSLLFVATQSYGLDASGLVNVKASALVGNVPPNSITEGDVTQHQAALLLDQSQITNLPAFVDTTYEDDLPTFTNDVRAAQTNIVEANNLSVVTWVNVPDLNITQSSVVQHTNALTITESQIVDLAHTVEANDLSFVVTWANVPDANITQSSVVQHTNALTITESQIVDLAHTVEANDLSFVVTWANVPDANITQSSVVQHTNALTITESQIVDLAHKTVSAGTGITVATNANDYAVSSVAVATKTVSTTTDTLGTTDKFVHVDDDTAGSQVTITLPVVSGNDGLTYHIKKLGTTADVVIDGAGAETIDDAITATLKTQYESLHIVCDGAEWWIH